MQILPDGSYAIQDDFSVEGEGTSSFVFCAGWLLEIVEIASGEFYFFSDGHEVRSRGKRFAVFYPPFSTVRSYVRDLRANVIGVGAVGQSEGLPKSPIIFETHFNGTFSSASEAVDVIDKGNEHRSIEPNSRMSLLSKRAKRLIDENYQVYPSIARVAARLGVSHAHLSRQFKRDLEMTPSEYLHHLRVADATFRLSVGEEIIEISGDVGYNDLSRFYKQFRKATSTSPGACRQMLNRT